MKFNLPILLVYLTSTLAAAQTRITGTVSDRKGPLPGMSIFLKGTYDGTSSDASGHYQLTTEESGKQVLVIQGVGYQSLEKVIECNGQEVWLEIQLSESINALNAVTITAGTLEASDERKSVVLRPLDIYTTPGSNGDLAAALQTLPGTATVGNDGRLFVRGGDASETAVFIDGLLVGNAYGSRTANVPTRSRFSPELFKGAFFSTGGYSAEYGQALSSALVLNTVDLPAQSQGDLSLMSLGGGYTHTWVGKSQSINASANYFNLAPYQRIIKQNFDWERAPSGWDGEVSFHQKTKNNGIFKAYIHSEGGGMGIWQPVPGAKDRGVFADLENRYNHGNVSMRQPLGKGWFVNGGYAYSHNRDRIETDTVGVFQRNSISHAKGVVTKDFGTRLTVKSGIDWFVKYYREELVVSGRSRGYRDDQFNYFAEGDFYFSNRLVARAGVRGGYASLAAQSWLTPRASLAYKVGAGQISAAYGLFRQLPDERFRMFDPKLQNAEATHYLLNYFLSRHNRTIRGELFHKQYNRLVTFDGTRIAPGAIRQEGTGYARGFDLFYRDRQTLKQTDFWVTYSFINSRRKFDFYQTPIQPSFAPTHNVSVVAKRFVGKLRSQLGATWSWNSGYPYVDPNYGESTAFKTRPFSSLSLSWSYLPRPNVILHAACNNVLGTQNVFGYRYATSPDTNGTFASLPIGQGADRFAMIGLFVTFSKDKNRNYLNNL